MQDDNGEPKSATDDQNPEVNNVDPSVNTASSNDQDSPKYMFTMGASHTLEATHVEFFNDDEEPEVDLGNITNSYTILTTPNTRIHKDHPIENMIGDVKSYEEPKRISKALSDPAWVEAMQEELLQLKLQKVWILMDLPKGHRAIEGIDYDKVFALVARIEAIRLFLAYASFMGFLVYQMDIKSAFLYGQIEEEDKFQMSSMGELTFFLGLQVKQKEDGIFISQDKYVAEILKKFNYTDVKSALTPVKDGDTDDVGVHLYRSMIGSLMYLIASRPDIMFAVCACARFQVTLKISYLLSVKRIFRYLKGKPTLDLWYSRNSPFELVAYTDSDYARATQDRKSTTRGCQFIGSRLIS
ncbi:putative ribonuclease H-like domain-containing protein [Tanacetum coccineum]